MQRLRHRLGYGVTLLLMATGLGSCQFLGSDKASDATTTPAAPGTETLIQAEEVIAAEPADGKKISANPIIAATPLTRSTDPDARVKVIKTGRTDPFAELRPSSRPVSDPKSNPTSNPKSALAVANIPSAAPKSSALGRPTVSKKPSSLQPLPNLNGAPGIVLPSLPAEPTLAKQVKVQGVMLIGGQPKAIVQAPQEGTIRTVGVGDSLSNGQIVVSSINISRNQEPMVVFSEAGRTVSVGVGKEPILSGGPALSSLAKPG